MARGATAGPTGRTDPRDVKGGGKIILTGAEGFDGYEIVEYVPTGAVGNILADVEEHLAKFVKGQQ